jgi:hypothetical protein
MSDESAPLAVEQQFFTALVTANVETLNDILSEDFLLIDVMSGSEVDKSTLLAVVGSGQLTFESIEQVNARERSYGTASVVTGRTQMSGRFGEQSFTAKSRYTHVYVEQNGGVWRLVSAQGTQIAE